MLKCKKCNIYLQDVEVETFDYGFNDYDTIDEVSTCMCPNCKEEYLVHRVYELKAENFKED